MSAELQSTIEEVVDVTTEGLPGRFRMSQLSARLLGLLNSDDVIAPLVPSLHEVFGGDGKHFLKLVEAVIRSAFLIELVKLPTIDSTKFRYRWASQLVGDPRWATVDECLSIARHLFASVVNWRQQDESNEDVLRASFDSSLLPYEAPIDYLLRSPQPVKRIHVESNVDWFAGEETLNTLRLRSFLRDPSTSPDAAFFATVYDKLKTKTYLTDRVLTGPFKTNREKRWEAHPDSVHFALRRSCLEIELTLISQILRFKNFPTEQAESIKARGLFPADQSTALCPITGEPLEYNAFRTEIMSPEHGLSTFQVGHLNPLKFEALADSHSGHVAGNIAWISDEGNRIQGSTAGILETRQFVRKIVKNYDDLGW